MCKARVDYVKMATLSAGQTQSVLCQDAASSAPSSSVAVCVDICTVVSAMTTQMATCASMYMQFRCKSILLQRSQAYITEAVHNSTQVVIAFVAEKEKTLPGEHNNTLWYLAHVVIYR